MRVWLVTIGEPLPIDSHAPRLLRTGVLADALWQRGHEVVWWSSSFDHTHKMHRVAADATVEYRPRYQLKLLRGPGYRRNVSIARLRDHRIVARRFSALAKNEVGPDIIVASYPTSGLCAAAESYARGSGIPVVVDIRDLWPDIFLELVPEWCRIPARIALSPLFREARTSLSGATSIVSNAQPFVDWGLRLAARAATPDDIEFPFGYNAQPPSSEQQAAATDFWRRLGISNEENRPIACFLGTFGRQVDIETVISAARLLQGAGSRFQFVLCGSGERLDACRSLAADLKGVVFPGWVDVPKIWTLMRMSTVGLAPYRPGSGFSSSLPNKPIEYLSASLPVVAGIDGYLGQVLRDFGCGINYPTGDARALAAKLLELESCSETVARLSQNAGEVFRKRFDAALVYGRFVDYLQTLVDRRCKK